MILNRVAGKPSLGRWPFELLKEGKERALQTEGIAGAKALVLACAWSHPRLARRPHTRSK